MSKASVARSQLKRLGLLVEAARRDQPEVLKARMQVGTEERGRGGGRGGEGEEERYRGGTGGGREELSEILKICMQANRVLRT